MNLPELAHDFSLLERLATSRLGDLQSHGAGHPVRPVEFDTSRFAHLGRLERLSSAEHTLILIALVPHVSPDFYARVIGEHLPDGGDLPVFGGVRGENHRGVLPTGETAQFILAGDDLTARLEVQRMLSGDHWLTQRRILWLDAVPEGEPVMSGRLILDPEIVERLTTGAVSLPRFSTTFPAEHIDTELDWEDVILLPDTLGQINEIENWVRFNDAIHAGWDVSRRVKPGYRALFHGPPGTGKTLTATLLGRSTNRPVFRIDLSRVVSKYIGETEKNLARLFDKAEHKDWILFFDEADALFGKRTDIRDAHDKYANQEVAYLLQRIEAHAGLVILATNQRGSIDDAFLRRFQVSVRFPMPQPEERHGIWLKVFPEQIPVADDVDWRDISSRFELTGAGIVNVAQFCAIESLAGTVAAVDRAFLESAILREFVKEGRMV
jgi:ATPase family associated with various cellular activities (AAA)